MANNNDNRNRSYKVRTEMGGEYRDVSGSWAAVIRETNPQLERLGFAAGDQVTLTSTSNAGFNGIVASGTGPTGSFHGVCLGLFDLV
jgi:hypothetical protein